MKNYMDGLWMLRNQWLKKTTRMNNITRIISPSLTDKLHWKNQIASKYLKGFFFVEDLCFFILFFMSGSEPVNRRCGFSQYSGEFPVVIDA